MPTCWISFGKLSANSVIDYDARERLLQRDIETDVRIGDTNRLLLDQQRLLKIRRAHEITEETFNRLWCLLMDTGCCG